MNFRCTKLSRSWSLCWLMTESDPELESPVPLSPWPAWIRSGPFCVTGKGRGENRVGSGGLGVCRASGSLMCGILGSAVGLLVLWHYLLCVGGKLIGIFLLLLLRLFFHLHTKRPLPLRFLPSPFLLLSPSDWQWRGCVYWRFNKLQVSLSAPGPGVRASDIRIHVEILPSCPLRTPPPFPLSPLPQLRGVSWPFNHLWNHPKIWNHLRFRFSSATLPQWPQPRPPAGVRAPSDLLDCGVPHLYPQPLIILVLAPLCPRGLLSGLSEVSAASTSDFCVSLSPPMRFGFLFHLATPSACLSLLAFLSFSSCGPSA